MATALQRQRIAAVRSALTLLRQRHFTAGYALVVSGSACAPATNNSFDINTINSENFDANMIVSPPIPASPLAPLRRHLVVPGGATPFALLNPNARRDILWPPLAAYSASRLPPTYPTAQDAFTLVVPSRFWLWHRKGIG